ncbi:MAG: Gfo/Idh/MocA family oxidoreductase [Planctomycetota bacterium]|jgi:predicted dehydrogenase
MGNNTNKKTGEVSRRDFIKTSTAVSLAAAFSPTAKVFAAGSDKIRIGVIGCGKRGSGAAIDCIRSADGVEIVAIGELFKDHLDTGIKKIKETLAKEKLPAEKLKVTEETCFVGFDAYKKVIACDVNMVILATPPHFRPTHLTAAIKAGKHVFMEKPVAVDPAGIRSVLASSEAARARNLAIVAGTQRRHQACYLETIRRIHTGDIGSIVSAQCYWVGDYDYYPAVLRKPGWSDMEWQCRNWNYFTWLSGDHIVEQHVHNIDIINWALQAHPVQALGIGGRQQRTGPEFGHIFDHFAIEFEYPNGIRVTSMCRQMTGCSARISENVVGTNGTAWMTAWGAACNIKGPRAYKFEADETNPYVQEHTDLIRSIRNGEPLNEGRNVAESTMAAIIGRMSAYTGRALQWDWAMNASKLDLNPPKYEFGDLPVQPVAVPGKTKLV